MTKQVPVDQVSRLVYRQTGKVLERGRDEEVVLAIADDGGIRVVTGDDRVSEGHIGDQGGGN